jgi:hypothetical protein
MRSSGVPNFQTPPPAETSTCTRALEGSILYRPHSARRCRSARSSIPCPAAYLPPARRRTRPSRRSHRL